MAVGHAQVPTPVPLLAVNLCPTDEGNFKGMLDTLPSHILRPSVPLGGRNRERGALLRHALERHAGRR